MRMGVGVFGEIANWSNGNQVDQPVGYPGFRFWEAATGLVASRSGLSTDTRLLTKLLRGEVGTPLSARGVLVLVDRKLP
jgi:hypothetical protein